MWNQTGLSDFPLPLPPCQLLTQLLTMHIKSSVLKGISIAGQEIIISQLEDDWTLFLKYSAQVACALDIIHVFFKASGLYLNVNKCELAVKDSVITSISNIVTYFGITINKDQKTRSTLNFTPL